MRVMELQEIMGSDDLLTMSNASPNGTACWRIEIYALSRGIRAALKQQSAPTEQEPLIARSGRKLST